VQVDIAELKKLLAETGLSVPMVSTGQIFAAGRCSFSSSDAGVRSKAETLFAGLIEIAAELGAMINVGRVRGGIEGNGSRAEAEARAADSLLRMSQTAAASGVRVVLEPVNRYEIDFINSCADAVDFLVRFGLDDMRIMPDVFHMNIEDQSIEGALMRHVERIGYVHFADSNRRYPGAGHLDFSKIIGSMRAAGYAGWVGVEILPVPDPDTAARGAIEYLRRFI
jgi:sugar phosphate isomerase/epimerase